MKTLMIGLSFCFALAALSGCGSSSADDGGSTGAPLSCNDPEHYKCDSYASIQQDERAITCDGATEVPSCPLAGVHASCAWSDIDGTNAYYWYDGNPESDADIKGDCDDQSGTLTMN